MVFSSPQDVGKQGFGSANVTASVFLDLLKKLEADKKSGVRRSPYNEVQLAQAFRDHCINEMGLFKRGEKWDIKTLEGFAVKHVAKGLAKEKRHNPQASNKENAKAFMKKDSGGVTNQKDLPGYLTQETPESPEAGAVKKADLITGLFDIATSGGPGVATLAMLLVNRIDSSIDSRGKSLKILTDKYRTRADTPDGKETLIVGLEEVMEVGDEIRVGKDLEDLAQSEDDPKCAAQLLKLKQGGDTTLTKDEVAKTLASEKDTLETDARKKAFSENKEEAVIGKDQPTEQNNLGAQTLAAQTKKPNYSGHPYYIRNNLKTEPKPTDDFLRINTKEKKETA